jgi:copper chaperone CopZ
MKNYKLILLSAMFLFGTSSLFAQNKTEKFKVFGNCGMCEKRIETAAKSIEGVAKAEWNKETKMMEVTFDESEANINKIQLAIVKVGHDTEMNKADDKVYNALPACCKYDREAVKADGHEGHKH